MNTATHLHVARLEPRTVLRIFRILLRWAWSLALVVLRVGLASRGLKVNYLRYDSSYTFHFYKFPDLSSLPMVTIPGTTLLPPVFVVVFLQSLPPLVFLL